MSGLFTPGTIAGAERTAQGSPGLGRHYVQFTIEKEGRMSLVGISWDAMDGFELTPGEKGSASDRLVILSRTHTIVVTGEGLTHIKGEIVARRLSGIEAGKLRVGVEVSSISAEPVSRVR